MSDIQTNEPPEAAPPHETDMNRINEVLAKVGIDPIEIKEALFERLERAGVAYESATIPADKDFHKSEVIRFTAALGAMI